MLYLHLEIATMYLNGDLCHCSVTISFLVVGYSEKVMFNKKTHTKKNPLKKLILDCVNTQK